MKLSEAIINLDGILIRDGEFSALNYCTVEMASPFLTFLENPKYIEALRNNKSVGCVISKKEIIDELPDNDWGIFCSEEPKKVFHAIHNSLVNNSDYKLKTYENKIGRNCKISPLAYIAPENVVIGNNVFIGEFVVINEHTSIGNDCVIHAGTVIGGKSFSFTRVEDNEVLGLVDMGQVVLEDNVEICSNCHIARGTLPSDTTLLGTHTKLDAMVHVGHGTKIGNRVFIAAGAQLSGNTVIGNDVWIGVNATISNRLVIGDSSRISLGAVVTKNILEGETVTGNFAIDHERFIQNMKRSITDD